MVAERFDEAAELQRVEIEVQQCAVDADRLLGEQLAYGKRRVLQRCDEFVRQLGVHLVRIELVLHQRVPRTMHAPERLLQRGRCRSTHAAKFLLRQLAAVHRACALDEVVRFVDEHGDSPLIRDRQRMQQRAAVEVVVVVADDDIGPSNHFLTQVIRADLMLERDLAQ